ncbi:NETI motif-containing protein [Ferdinandcohnia quinoae]|uniref:NETI motif-containing protein n=1 Tax=Fredinandcohnia quinoae TaxID=2918902 RepID=A0AAW5E5M5_9BACI|nr:NETI motif-containing protein [Fredinandcohnia sp. SECRCQ15]MCH1624686.1 NETI motif-containing protein [Fredinandcohnia sp. SECRCQ15]
MKKPNKQKFTVEENETIDQCLERMKTEGYAPTRRMEEPIFQEVNRNGRIEVEPCGRRIIFEGRLE